MNMVGRRLRSLGARDFLKANQHQADDDDRNDGLYYSHSCPFLTDHKYFREGDSTAVQAPLQAFSNESVADLIFAGFIEILDTAI